jgi:hypothetical protein
MGGTAPNTHAVEGQHPVGIFSAVGASLWKWGGSPESPVAESRIRVTDVTKRG